MDISINRRGAKRTANAISGLDNGIKNKSAQTKQSKVMSEKNPSQRKIELRTIIIVQTTFRHT